MQQLLSHWPLPTVRLTCKTCGTENEMSRDAMIAIYGDLDMSLLRDELVCGKGAAGCQMIYADALLADAIVETDPEKVTARLIGRTDILEQAEEWKQRLGSRALEFKRAA